MPFVHLGVWYILFSAINIVLSWNDGTKITFYGVPHGAPWCLSAPQTETVWVGTTALEGFLSETWVKMMTVGLKTKIKYLTKWTNKKYLKNCSFVL